MPFPEALFEVLGSIFGVIVMIAFFALAIAVLVRVMRFTFDLFDLW